MASARDEGRRPIVKPVSVIATGLAAAGAAFLTSRFGIAGTILGTAVMAMLITAGASVLEVYLETAAAKARTVPSDLGSRGTPANAGSKAADTTHRGSGGFFARFASLPAARRRSVLAGTFTAAVLSFLIAVAAVTGVEFSVGKSLSCWLWDQCPERSSGERPRSEVGTRPSILGGQQMPGANQGADDAPQGQPPDHRPTLPGPSQRQRVMGPNPHSGRTVYQAPGQDVGGEPVETRPGTPSRDLDRARGSPSMLREHPRPVPGNGSVFPDEVSPSRSR
jgi:hypothetical protein